jgi:hypothetical protein
MQSGSRQVGCFGRSGPITLLTSLNQGKYPIILRLTGLLHRAFISVIAIAVVGFPRRPKDMKTTICIFICAAHRASYKTYLIYLIGSKQEVWQCVGRSMTISLSRLALACAWLAFALNGTALSKSFN